MDVKFMYSLLLTDLTTQKFAYCSFLFLTIVIILFVDGYFLVVSLFTHSFVHFISSHNIKFTLLTTHYKNNKTTYGTIYIYDDKNKIFLVQR